MILEWGGADLFLCCLTKPAPFLLFSCSSNVTDYERKIRLDQHLTATELFKKRKAEESGYPKMNSHTSKEEIQIESSVDKTSELHQTKKLKFKDLSDRYNATATTVNKYEFSDVSKISMDTEENEINTISWDFSQLKFPNLAEPQSLQLERPNDTFLPYTCEQSKKPWLLKIIPKTNDALEFSHKSSNLDPKVKCKNWAEYKREIKRFVGDEELVETPCGHYWNCEVTPLVKPRDATCTGISLV